MRILHLCPYDLRQPGGVQTHTLALSDSLNGLGHDSRVFSPRRPLRVSLGGTRADLCFDPRDLLALRGFLQSGQAPFDILHIQEPLLPLLGPLSLLHPTSAPTVVTLHSAEPAARTFYRRTRSLIRALLQRADAVICASEISKQTAAGCLPAQVESIFPCLDLSPFFAAKRDPEPNTILFVGRDEPRKGLPILLRAIERLPDAQLQLRLIVAGPVSPVTRKLADQRTTFLGPVPHSEIPALLGRASCAAFPASGGEALGLVLIEAMAAGVPVAATDIPGYRLASDSGAAALLSPPGDSAALAQNLARLLVDADLRARLAERGRRQAAQFDARVVAQRHVDLYRSLLQP